MEKQSVMRSPVRSIFPRSDALAEPRRARITFVDEIMIDNKVLAYLIKVIDNIILPICKTSRHNLHI